MIGHILSINKTRLDGSVDNNAVQLEGCHLIRKDRSRERGGVAIHFRDHLNIKERIELMPDCKADIDSNVISTTKHSLFNFIKKTVLFHEILFYKIISGDIPIGLTLI